MIMGALDVFMKMLRKEMNLIEGKLQTEESGSKIAFLQGNCAGYRSLCNTLSENGCEDYSLNKETDDGILTYDTKHEEWAVTTSDYNILIHWHLTAMDIEEVMSASRDAFKKRVEQMKDKLFYHAEKGRDLHFVKGWWFIYSVFDEWCAKINAAYDAAQKRKKRELPFDDDEENRDPFDIG